MPEKSAAPLSSSDTRPVMEADLTEENVVKLRARNRRSLMAYRRNSMLPFQWRITHSSRWMAQVVASEFSLVAFLVLLVMVFSKKWLYPCRSRFHQRFPKNITNKIYTSIHTMSTGPLYVCISKSCSEDDKGFLCVALAVLELVRSVDQAGLELRLRPASGTRVSGLKACATTPGFAFCLLISEESMLSTAFATHSCHCDGTK